MIRLTIILKSGRELCGEYNWRMLLERIRECAASKEVAAYFWEAA